MKSEITASVAQYKNFSSRLFATALAMALFSSLALGTTYYVSNDGNDANNGLSPSTAFKTIAYAGSRVANGDTILLERGDVFYESVSFSRSNLTIDAYGPNDLDLPVVSGGTKITSWQPYSGAIYVADVGVDIGYLTADGNHINIARYPNMGWLRTTTWTENGDGTNTIVTCSGLTSHTPNTNDYWNGANMRWHRHSWWFETRPVTDYVASTGQLYLGDKSIIAVEPYDKNGWGFYLDNKFEELDAPGEFFYDKPNHKVYLWAPNGGDPNYMLVEGSTRSGGLSVSASTVRNIAFRHQNSYGLQITGATTVEGCRFEFIGSDSGGAGLNATWGVQNALVRNNLFRNNYNAAIGWNQQPGTPSCTIEYNTLLNNGTFPGYGGEGPWMAMAIVASNATALHVQHNFIKGAGYAGIIFGSNGNFAEYNTIINAMFTLNDGAAIYTNCSQTTFRGNTIIDTRGGMDSSGPWAKLAHGIWPEFLSQFRDNVIENNTIINSGGFGIFLENNFNCVVRNNTIFSNDRAAFWLAQQNTTPQTHVIENNIFYADENAGSDSGRTLLFMAGVDYGSMNNNYFCNPFTNLHITPATASWSWQSPITIASWQATYPSWADANAKTDIAKLGYTPSLANPVGLSEIFVNDTNTPATIPLPNTYRDLDGNTVQHYLDLEPFSSKIMVLTEVGQIATHIALDSLSSAKDNDSGASTLTFSHTIHDGYDRALVVGVGAEDSSLADMAITSVTYNGVPMSAVPNSTVSTGTASIIKTALFYMLNDQLPAPGTYSVTVTFAGTVTDRAAGAVSLFNVDQNAPQAVVNNYASDPGLKIIYTDITILVDNTWVIDVVNSGDPGSFSTNAWPMLEWFDQSLGSANVAGGIKVVPKAGTTTMSWQHNTQKSITHSLAAFAPANVILPLGDLNLDRHVDLSDVDIFAEQWLTAGPEADLDDSTNVDFIDFALIGQNWRQ